MTLKKLTDKSVTPKPVAKQSLAIYPDNGRPLLRFREGWFFGLGFFTAAFVFSFVIVPAIACMVMLAISIGGSAILGGG